MKVSNQLNLREKQLWIKKILKEIVMDFYDKFVENLNVLHVETSSL